MRIIRRYQPDRDRMLKALMLVLSSTHSPTVEVALPGETCRGDACGCPLQALGDAVLATAVDNTTAPDAPDEMEASD